MPYTPHMLPSACLRYGFGAQRETISPFFSSAMTKERCKFPLRRGKGDVSTRTNHDLTKF